MGAWGTANFENDQALDWVGNLLESDSLKPVEDALKLASKKPQSLFQRVFRSHAQGSFIDADIASNALAAAEVVAALRQRPCESLPEGLLDWVESHKSLFQDSLASLAIRAVEMVQSSSELAELWSESEELDNWIAELAKLKGRLA